MAIAALVAMTMPPDRASEQRIPAVDEERIASVIAGGGAHQVNRDAAEVTALAPDDVAWAQCITQQRTLPQLIGPAIPEFTILGAKIEVSCSSRSKIIEFWILFSLTWKFVNRSPF